MSGTGSDPTPPPVMLVNIQFLRFVAAMLVVFYHCSIHLESTGHDIGWLFEVFKAVGFAGVDIFFVISGFIMAYTTVGLKGRGPSIEFFKRRVARIYSGYWPFYLIAIGVFAWVGGSHLAEVNLWNSFLLWPGGVPLIRIAWTLTYEMFFYILFAFVILLTSSRREQVLVVMLLGIIAWSLYSQFVRHAYDEGRLIYMSLAEVYMARPYLAEFLGGAVLAGWLARNPAGRSWSLLLAGSALFLAGTWVNNGLFEGNFEQAYFVFWRVLLFGSASLLILAGLVRLEYAKTMAPHGFSLAAGGASYAIYLSHILWLTATQHMGLNDFLGRQSAWVAQGVFLLYAVFVLYYSIAHYRIVERPLHHLFRRALGIGAGKSRSG